jgi:hypothetical protein
VIDELNSLQERLQRHFKSLADSRAEYGLPIFALEHDLTESELAQMSGVLQYRLAAGHSPTPHWLLWVIYATEQGYSYVGDEYWQSFEQQTPNWDGSDRDRLKLWFRKFQKAYQGVVPEGPWANHFSIIAWPITHAILPRYLQRQFAKALYDLRYRLASLANFGASDIGRLLAANSYYASTRFEKFLEQEELTGRIVLGLLGAESGVGEGPIYRPTLRRIVEDLEKVRASREWLKDTRRVVADRFIGIGKGHGPKIGHSQGSLALADSEPTLAIRPRIMLRYMGEGRWDVLIDIPSFRGLTALNHELRDVVQKSRLSINGSPDKKPAGWTLSARRAVLRHWPDPNEPLINFERSTAALTQLLDSECRIDPGPTWLFRVGSDGIAREIVGRIVRPGQSYIVVTSTDLPRTGVEMTECRLECQGVQAFRLTIPQTVSSELSTCLHHLGVSVARTIKVWAAGLPSRGWDGEGASEWLTTETPFLGIAHDHPVDAFVMRLNQGAENVVPGSVGGESLFIKLPRLPVGTHRLTIRARPGQRGSGSVSASPEGFMQLLVRDPEPWRPGVTSYSGMVVTVDPPSADLDTLWRNELRISVSGPESHSIRIAVCLESGDGREVLREEIARCELPLTAEEWHRRFSQFLQREDRAWSYLEAARGTLTIDAETLGKHELQFEHEVQPLRWVLRRDRGKVFVRLVDDTGDNETEPLIKFSTMDHPLQGCRVDIDRARSGIEVSPPGALFFSMRGPHRDIVVVSTGLTGQGLHGLSVQPQLTEIRDNSVTYAKAVRVLGTWYSARLYGFLADIRRQQVTRAINDAIVRGLCGGRWSAAEDRYKRNSKSRQALDALKAEVDRRPSFAAVLVHEPWRFDGETDRRDRNFSEIARRYGICSDEKLCAIALRLADGSARPTKALANEDVMAQLARHPALVRGARLLAVIAGAEAKSEVSNGLRRD